MSTTGIERRRYELDEVVAAATAGDELAFSQLFDRYRRELQVHAYRILGSHEDSADLTQETFLRAWRMRRTFEGRSSFRSWLYRIATNACLSALERRASRRRHALHEHELAATDGATAESLLEGIASGDAEPDAELLSKETVELVLLAAVQHLPPRQRAVLVLRDVLGWSAKDTADVLGASVASVTSASQRARETLRKRLPGPRIEWAPGADPSEEERVLLERYLAAAVCGDADEFVAVVLDEPGLSPEAELAGARG